MLKCSGRWPGVALWICCLLGSQGPAGGGNGPLWALPITFDGDLLRADCRGMRRQVELSADQAFFLRRTDHDEGYDASVDHGGNWLVVSDQRPLPLSTGGGAPLSLAIRDASTPRQRDLGSRDIASCRDAALRRAQHISPQEPQRLRRGMYMYFADAGRFTDCLTGQSWPVAQEADNATLESAYVRARSQPGEEILVELEGRVAMRPKMEGEGQHPALVVERFIGLWPGERCGGHSAAEPLEHTYWRLTHLGDTPVTVTSPQREPHIMLDAETRRLSGASGCNRLLGSYERHGERLTFDHIAGTRMACPEGSDTEHAFIEALSQVHTWKIMGPHLEMFDAAGNLLARFEARPRR